MQRKVKKVNVLAPRPVHPRAVRVHGLFGLTYVRQHMMADERWTPASITEQYKGMGNLLAKRRDFKRQEYQANRKRQAHQHQNLRRDCREGRNKLQMVMFGKNTKMIRNFLLNHKDMQRLYQKMPVPMVVENINQRTFVLRKERDRLRFRLEQLKEIYETQLIERSRIENRIKYEDEFVLEEEVRCREFRKKVANSDIRLQAIKAINVTYKKMIQVLMQDSIFYEPIIRSLNFDVEDQSNFIKHILFLGTPAISKFRELSEEYKQLEDKSRKSMHTNLQHIAKFKREGRMGSVTVHKPLLTMSKQMEEVLRGKRYVRETLNMHFMKNELEVIEATIKRVKNATLCSQSKQVFPRIKGQLDSNKKLFALIENNSFGRNIMETKQVRAKVLEDVLINNLTEAEINRLEYIKSLRRALDDENDVERRILEHMKNRADILVLLRFALWNLCEILRFIDQSQRTTKISYPNSYLKLPLLKFEMLTEPMRATAPDVFETNVEKMLYNVRRRLRILMKVYDKAAIPPDVEDSRNKYHEEFLENIFTDDLSDEEHQLEERDEDMLADAKLQQNVPSRKQIKAQSAKLVEESAKRDE